MSQAARTLGENLGEPSGQKDERMMSLPSPDPGHASGLFRDEFVGTNAVVTWRLQMHRFQAAARVYRTMKDHGLQLHRQASGVGQRPHDGKIAVDRSNLRWCSDGFELACDRKSEQAITTPRALSLPKLILTW